MKYLQEKYPEAVELVLAENARQYPDAQFLSYSVEHSGEDGIVINIYFNIGKQDKVLWAFVFYSKETPEDTFIDEYYEIDDGEIIE